MKFVKLGILLLAVGASSGVYADEFYLGGSQSTSVSRDSADANGTISPERRRRRFGFWQCYARNNRGVVFSASSWNRGTARNSAMRACRSRSRNPWSCYSVGCRRGWGW